MQGSKHQNGLQVHHYRLYSDAKIIKHNQLQGEKKIEVRLKKNPEARTETKNWKKKKK